MRFSTVIMAAQEVKPIFYATDGVWKAIIQLGMIAVLMLIAHVLRRKLPVIRKSLMPVSVIAGFLMLGVKLLLLILNVLLVLFLLACAFLYLQAYVL